MSCGTQPPPDGLQPERRAALKAGFARMWPAKAPFPPAMPWLAAVVNRGQAWAWVADLARQDGSVSLDTTGQALDFVGRALNAGGVYANERRREKRLRRQTRRGNNNSCDFTYYYRGTTVQVSANCLEEEYCCMGVTWDGTPYAECRSSPCFPGERGGLGGEGHRGDIGVPIGADP